MFIGQFLGMYNCDLNFTIVFCLLLLYDLLGLRLPPRFRPQGCYQYSPSRFRPQGCYKYLPSRFRPQGYYYLPSRFRPQGCYNYLPSRFCPQGCYYYLPLRFRPQGCFIYLGGFALKVMFTFKVSPSRLL